jgi:gas vesicle protein
VVIEEHQYMNSHVQEHRNYGFVIGLMTGTFVGAGLTMWLAPRMASEVRQRMTDSARRLGQRASEQYQQASTQVGDAVDELTRKAQGLRDDVAGAVAHGAREVERFATAAKSDRVPDAGKYAPADRSASPARSL